jgi:predicted phosphoadenosine phosphosulfate sulfurtransferase
MINIKNELTYNPIYNVWYQLEKVHSSPFRVSYLLNKTISFKDHSEWRRFTSLLLAAIKVNHYEKLN